MIPDLPIDEPIPLARCGTWPAAVHLFDQASADAVLAALAAERPLLVKGEPGAGKSQLARAAAAILILAISPGFGLWGSRLEAVQHERH